MNWYYAKDGGQIGPIEPAEFDRLVQQGDIKSDTLVWREGMANWQAYGETGASPLTAAANVEGGSIRCVECGKFFTLDEVIPLGTGYVCGNCKPVVLQKIGEGVMTSRAEQIRREHIKHEASVKSIGTLYFLGAIAVLLMAAVSVLAGTAASIIMGILLVALAGGQVFVAFGLNKLKRWARIPTGVISGLGLLAFPLGTVINGYILYLIFSRKGTMVFSDEYQQVIAETPHIKYRTSIVVWIVLGLVLLLIAMGLFMAVYRSRVR
jgi:hypothetical protein